MDMREFISGRDISRYAPPANFELNGRQFNAVLNDGESALLVIPRESGPHCVKITEDIWLITQLPTGGPIACVLHPGAGLVTLVSREPNGGFDFSFGTLGKASEFRHALTDELDGNVMEWTLGITDSSVFRMSVKGDKVQVLRPRVLSAQAVEEDFKAAKITETVYLVGGKSIVNGESAILLCDFCHLLCVGSVFAPDVGVPPIGGYGRIVPDA